MARVPARIRKASFGTVFVILLLCLYPSRAAADAGIPMLPFAYPVILVFLVPVVAIETIYLRVRLRTEWRNTLISTAKANALTMLLGFPLSWLISFLAEMLLWVVLYSTGAEKHLSWSPGLHIANILVVALSAPWMGPINGASWTIPFAFVVLMIPSFLLSGYVESYLLDRQSWLRYEGNSTSAIWQANVLSYIFLAVVGSSVLWFTIQHF